MTFQSGFKVQNSRCSALRLKTRTTEAPPSSPWTGSSSLIGCWQPVSQQMQPPDWTLAACESADAAPWLDAGSRLEPRPERHERNRRRSLDQDWRRPRPPTPSSSSSCMEAWLHPLLPFSSSSSSPLLLVLLFIPLLLLYPPPSPSSSSSSVCSSSSLSSFLLLHLAPPPLAPPPAPSLWLIEACFTQKATSSWGCHAPPLLLLVMERWPRLRDPEVQRESERASAVLWQLVWMRGDVMVWGRVHCGSSERELTEPTWST